MKRKVYALVVRHLIDKKKDVWSSFDVIRFYSSSRRAKDGLRYFRERELSSSVFHCYVQYFVISYDLY